MSAPFLSSERLEYWKPDASDFEALFELVSHPETCRYLGPAPTRADTYQRFQRNAGSWLLHGYGMLMVRQKGYTDLIGNCGIFQSWRDLGEDFDNCPEAGWIIGADHVGKGSAGEAMRTILAWFDREFGPKRMVCMIEPDNAASIRLADKLGFAPMRDAEFPDGARVRLFERSTGAFEPD